MLAAALGRRGLALESVVTARDADMAEQAFFRPQARGIDGHRRSSARPAPTAAVARDEFVGLSPDAGG